MFQYTKSKLDINAPSYVPKTFSSNFILKTEENDQSMEDKENNQNLPNIDDKDSLFTNFSNLFISLPKTKPIVIEEKVICEMDGNLTILFFRNFLR